MHPKPSRKISITCCAVAQSRVLRKAWVPYGNIETSTPHSSATSHAITMRLCTFDNVREINTIAKFGWNRPLGYVSRIREIYTSCDFFLPSCLPAFLSCAPALAKRIEIIPRTLAQKRQFGVRKCPPSKVFSLSWRFEGHFAPKPQTFRPY